MKERKMTKATMGSAIISVRFLCSADDDFAVEEVVYAAVVVGSWVWLKILDGAIAKAFAMSVWK
jgi:hypothetical protein